MNEQERGVGTESRHLRFAGLAVLVVPGRRASVKASNLLRSEDSVSDASGLLKGSDVLMQGGAKIGRVSGRPRLAGQGVEVALRIYDYVKIPRGQ